MTFRTCALLALAVSTAFLGCHKDSPEEKAKSAKVSRKIAEVKPFIPMRGERAAKPVSAFSDEERAEMAPADARLMDAMEKAMDEECLDDLKRMVGDVRMSTNVDVRSEFVDNLGWFGRPAMVELTPFMLDPNRDVAENAVSCWTSALDEIEDEKIKVDLIEGVMKVLQNDDDLEALALELNGCDEARVLQTLINVIGSDNEAGAKAAREHYEFVTGEEFTTVEAANKWIEENYTPDE